MMRPAQRRVLITAALAAVLVVPITSSYGLAREAPEPSSEVRGASLGLFASDPEYDYQVMLEEMRSRGAHDVLIVFRLMQDDVGADTLRLRPGDSPSEANIRRTLRRARQMGFRVAVMPIVGLIHRPAGEWRGEIAPPRPERWFESYGDHLAKIADWCQAEGVRRLIIGSELNHLESYEQAWRTLVENTRARYDGELVYSANWDRYATVLFWDALDAMAVSAYFGMDGEPVQRWSSHLQQLSRFAQEHDRPVLLSEVGYPAHADAGRFPWDETREAPIDTALQAELLGSFCEAWSTRPLELGGYYIWNWFGRGGPRDASYSLRGKPAAAVFERCMEEG